jgi:uncharacterized protein YcbK (DUF882 family)
MKKQETPSLTGGIDRRGFLRATSAGLGMAAVATTGILTPTRGASARLTESGARELSFVNLHTGERLTAAYKVDGRLDPGALRDINYVLRDWRTDDVIDMDVDTLDIVFDLQQTLGSTAPVEIISGYRSPRTNAMLAARSNGVARRSLHQYGKAIDINLPDQEIMDMARTAFRMGRGGVGAYRRSGFVHVDSGRPRKWNF